MKLSTILLSALCCIFLLLATDVYADDLWTLKQCIDYATKNNPDLQADRTKISMSRYDYDYQRTLFFPHLDIAAGTGYLTGEPTSALAVVRNITDEGDISKNVSGGYILGALTLNIPLLREGVLFARNAPTLNIAATQIAEYESSFEAKKNQVIYETGVAFFSVLKNREDIRISEERLKSLRLNYETAQSKYREGLLPKNELLASEVSLATGENELNTAKNNAQLLNAELSQKLGLDPAKTIAVSSEDIVLAPPPPLTEMLSIALANRQELKVKEAEVLKAKEGERQEKSKNYPSVDFISSYSAANNYGSQSNGLFTGAVQVSMPLFDFGASKAKVAGMRLKVEEGQSLLQAAKQTIEKEVIAAITGIQNIKALLSLQEKIVMLHTEELRLMKGKFEQSLVPLSSVREAEYALYDSQKAFAQQQYDLRLAYMQLVKALGSDKVLSLMR